MLNKNLGSVKRLLGMTIEYDVSKGVLAVHQQSFIKGLLEEYGLSDCNPSRTPGHVVYKMYTNGRNRTRLLMS